MTFPPPNDDWLECPPGTLSQLRTSAPTARRLSPFPAGVVVGITACLLFATFSVFFSGGEPAATQPIGMLTCTEVLPLLVDYQSGRLNADVALAVKSHLAECESCRARLDQLTHRPAIGQYWAAHSIEPRYRAMLVARR